MSKVNLRELLNKMTTKQKIAQLEQLAARYFTKNKTDITGPLRDLGLTEDELKIIGTNLGIGSVEDMIDVQNRHLDEDPNHIPMIFMSDIIHGFRTIYPIPLALGCSFDDQLVYECSRMAAREASVGGLQATFTPMVDCIRDARWGRVMESCGEDPYLNGIMGQAQVKGFQGDDISNPGNIAACVKHFAGYSAGEAGRDYNMAELSEHSLRQVHFPAYKACVDAGVKMVMPSFNVLNGVPSVANKWLVNGVLRNEWGFDGIVISDWDAVYELTQHGVAADLKEAALLAFENGCNIEMMSFSYISHLEELINEGKISVDRLDEYVMKVLEFKEELGLFDDPYHGASSEDSKKLFLCSEHREISRRAARESAVLLKNDNILPLDRKLKSIALIGPFANSDDINGAWSCAGRRNECVTVKEGIRNLLPEVDIKYAKGCESYLNDRNISGFEQAIVTAKSADAVILCLGEPSDYSGEERSRTELTLPGMQLELARAVIDANPNTAVVLFGGRPLELVELDSIAPAILHMWFPGTEGGNAVSELLFGVYSPCGKLSVSFPKKVGQCPIYYNYTNTGRPKSRYIDCDKFPQYFFGYGLSYNKFTYNSMILSSHTIDKNSSIKVSVEVTNEGCMSGKETVQLYLRDLVSSASRPVQELISFKKVNFEKGETKTVEFEITEPMLRFWNADNEFVSERGEFEISVGYADHMKFTEKFSLI
ncbi:MAG: glycoside hydrolase family 3 C-terminal domain-containing protein [Clostridia bacterium]|nr:glycoside hydrolase family 3 C-terminal domain-containing protein [Clostridia bacterium]